MMKRKTNVSSLSTTYNTQVTFNNHLLSKCLILILRELWVDQANWFKVIQLSLPHFNQRANKPR